MSEKTYSILFAGVGGQGVLLAAEITALVAVQAGFDVKQTEVHGVSQRGGSVETHVRFGPRVWSPVVTPGKSDFVVGLEKLEALRFAQFVHPTEGLVLINMHEIIPGSVPNAADTYPHHAVDFLLEKGYRILTLEATRIAHELGDGRMANVVMIGALSSMLPMPKKTWLDVLQQRIPDKYRAANLEAIIAGREGVAETAG